MNTNLGRLERALSHVDSTDPSKMGHLDQLAWLRVAQNELANLVDDAVGRLRAVDDASWAEIGNALEISRQGAQQRFGS